MFTVFCCALTFPRVGESTSATISSSRSKVGAMSLASPCQGVRLTTTSCVGRVSERGWQRARVCGRKHEPFHGQHCQHTKCGDVYDDTVLFGV